MSLEYVRDVKIFLLESGSLREGQPGGLMSVDLRWPCVNMKERTEEEL